MTAAEVPQPPPPLPIDKTLEQDYSGLAEEVDDCPPDDKTSLDGPYSRLLGDTEHNWCRAVGSGTGITVLSIVFSKRVDTSALQKAVDFVQMQHPRLRSQLLWINGRPAFKVVEGPCVRVEIVDASSPPPTPVPEVEEFEGREEDNSVGVKESKEDNSVTAQEWNTAELQDAESHPWMSHIETELNENIWPELENSLDPVQMFVVRLYWLPENRSLLILRLHTAVCDRVAAGTVVVDMLSSLRQNSDSCQEEEKPSTPSGPNVDDSKPGRTGSLGRYDRATEFMSVEAAIPPGQARKRFWAHGLDLIGYSLGSMRHALLPFEDAESPRLSKFFHSVLTVEHTKLLLEACEKNNTSLYGALSAAGLKAAAAAKLLGRHSEHFALVSLIDCRHLLQPELSDAAVGFYHSALINAHHVNEQTDFWELAKRCSTTLDNAMRNRKHFTDMGDINYLMYQALQRPGLTPYSSLRTSLLVVFRDPLVQYMEEVLEALGIEHYLGCSSCHGVGPMLAIFDSIRKGALHFTGVYPSPLYSRTQILIYVRFIVDILVQSIETQAA